MENSKGQCKGKTLKLKNEKFKNMEINKKMENENKIGLLPKNVKWKVSNI